MQSTKKHHVFIFIFLKSWKGLKRDTLYFYRYVVFIFFKNLQCILLCVCYLSWISFVAVPCVWTFDIILSKAFSACFYLSIMQWMWKSKRPIAVFFLRRLAILLSPVACCCRCGWMWWRFFLPACLIAIHHINKKQCVYVFLSSHLSLDWCALGTKSQFATSKIQHSSSWNQAKKPCAVSLLFYILSF